MLHKLREFFSRLRLRTLLASVAVALIGIADVINLIDLHSLVGLFVHEAKVGSVVAIIGLLFGLLRLVTTSAVLAPKDGGEE
jgi:hypothetical protein